MCESLDEMINSLNEVFSQANPKVEEKNGEFLMEFEASGFGIKKKFIIKLIKHEIEKPKEINNELYSNNMNLNNMNFMGMNYNMNIRDPIEDDMSYQMKNNCNFRNNALNAVYKNMEE